MDDINIEPKKVNPVTLLAIFIEAILIIISVNITIDLFFSIEDQGEPMRYDIEISNFYQELPFINKQGLKGISFSIYDIVWLNAQDKSKIPDTIYADIRPESIKQEFFEKDQIQKVYFLLDIPELEQSYQVQYLFSNTVGYNGKLPTNYRIMVYCPSDSQLIFSEQNCTDRYAGKAEDIIRDLKFE